jgi:crotonobetainyl-CoA:carnitine CoA-transferase CaiB-like acyl-CoA transferase
VLNRPDLLTDPRFAKPGSRLQNMSLLNDELAPSIAAMTTADFIAGAKMHEVPMGPVNTLEQFFDHPQAKHNRIFQEIEDAEFGRMRGLNFFAAFSDTPLSLTRRAPMLGEQTDSILRTTGRADDEIKSLRETKVVR